MILAMRMWAVSWAAALAMMQCCLLLLVFLQPAAVAGDSSMPSLLWANESNAMLSLRGQLGIKDRAWPAKQDPCAWWRGVLCLNGHIDTLLLTGLPRFSGQRPLGNVNAFTQLPFLRSLNASQVWFPGQLPDWFGDLHTLESLDLTGCSLNGSMPSSFGSLSGLQTLSLADNNLSGSMPPSFSNMSALTFLNMSGNAFTGPIPYLNASLLTIVDLSRNNFSGAIPPQVGLLPNLQVLILAGNQLSSSVPAELGNLVLLNQLDLSSNFLVGSIPPELGRMMNLTILSLADNNLTGVIPPALTGCQVLSVINLNDNKLSGNLPNTIGIMQSLVEFHVSNNNLKGMYPSGMLTLPLLQILDISRNMFFGPLPQQISTQQTLVGLELQNNFFNETVPMGLPAFANTKRNCLVQVERQHTEKACTMFYARMGVDFSFNATAPPSYAGPAPASAESPSGPITQQNSTRIRTAPILAGIFGGSGLILFVGALLLCLHRCQLRRSRERAMESGRVSAVGEGNRRGHAYTYSQLQTATNKFSSSNLIAIGHSGDLYKGETSSGTPVVVKKIDLTKVKRDLYISELEVFDRICHNKVVPLVGHCLDREDEKFLVYRYYPNSDLGSSLHKKDSPGAMEDALQSLDWITRLKIAIGTAEALAYLHSECSPPIIHRDVKASSILLDDKYEVRIGSLCEARSQDGESHSNILSRMFGFSSSSHDNLDSSHGIVSCAYDVYCFGKVLLELVSGKLGISGTNDTQWLDWALPLINVNDKEALPKIVDPSLIVDEDLFEEVWAMAIIAKACLNSRPSKRPSMKHILKALENPHKVVREENFGESLAVRTSSHSSWNEALFGSWRHHSSVSDQFRTGEGNVGMLSIARAGVPASSSSHLHTRRGSCDVVPEPIEEETHESDDPR